MSPDLRAPRSELEAFGQPNDRTTSERPNDKFLAVKAAA